MIVLGGKPRKVWGKSNSVFQGYSSSFYPLQNIFIIVPTSHPLWIISEFIFENLLINLLSDIIKSKLYPLRGKSKKDT
jgi:hypothetical protein